MKTLSLNMPHGGGLNYALSRHTQVSSASIARLSSGDRIQRAGDDVAAMSVSTKLATRISALRTGRTNAEQAASMLQVMDGGLAQMLEGLQRMKALSVQASSGSLTAAERGFLNQEFQQLALEVDRIAQQTNFNGINVLDAEGIEETINAIETDSELANEASAYLMFISNPANNRRIRIQNLNFQFRNAVNPNNPLHVQRGGNVQETVRNLVTAFQNHPDLRMQEARYEVFGGNSVKITHLSRGELAKNFTIDEQGSNSRNNFITLGGDVILTSGQGRFRLGSEASTGVGHDSVVGIGSTGSGMLAAQSQTSGEVRLSMNALASSINNNQRLRIDNGFGGTNQFRFRTNANPANQFHIQIGPDNKESLKNAVTELYDWLNQTTTQRVYAHEQLDYERDGLDLIFRYKGAGNGADFRENNIQVTEAVTGGAMSANFITSGTDSGINTSGVNNADFYGIIQGFEATYIDTNQVNLSLKVGEHTYTTAISDTLPTALTRVRMASETGGYIDLDLASGGGALVLDQDGADLYAKRMDEAFDGVRFYQERTVTSFRPGGDLSDTQLRVELDDFSEPLVIEDFTVTAGGDRNLASDSAVFSITINGEVFTSTKTIERGVEPMAQIRMHSERDPNRVVTFVNSTTEFETETDKEAADFEALMKEWLPFGEVIEATNQEVDFQVGVRSDERLNVFLNSMRTDRIFAGETPEISTVAFAEAAQDSVQDAIEQVIFRRAQVGAQQSRTDYVIDNIGSAINNQQAAEARLSDTDVASESTELAGVVVRQQSTIALIAQTNRLHSDFISGVYDPQLQAAESSSLI